MNGFGDFVNGGFPLPQEPVFYPGMGSLRDFVNGGFPLPQVPVFFPSSQGSLPKAPPMPRAMIAHGSDGPATPTVSSVNGLGCGGGCGCSDCGGMGALSSDTIIPQASLPAFLQGDAYITGFPTVYLALGVVVAAFALMGGSKRGRR